ncbi:MAG: DEAD/DEAH box helicase [Candidatus Micrarchaeia archaeon]
MKFKEMSVSDRTIAALDELGYFDATEVQERAIPLIMQGRDILVRSQTGTGKTAAFGIGIVELMLKDKMKKALVMAPTRELALQITKEVRSISRHHRLNVYAIYGGQDMFGQTRLLKQGYDIVVATPGRLLDHFRRGNLDLAEFSIVILDEADRMLDMGFKEDIDEILRQVYHGKQMMLFSATFDKNVKSIINNYMRSPEWVEVGEEKVGTIKEEFIEVSRKDKMRKLEEIIKKDPNSRMIVFVATQRCAEFVCFKLNQYHINARDLHGGKKQNQRERIMRGFKEGEFNVLVATDVASRGLHIDNVAHIINYDKANDNETHTHRIGRTGRMGKEGKATTFVDVEIPPVADYKNISYGRRRNNNRVFRR